jgi:Zn ribbon nucleic-acid-binding protein
LADIICLHTRRSEHRFVPGAKSIDPTERDKLRQMGDAIFAAEKTFIDNQKLDGFLAGLKKIDCRYVSCDKCGYCERFAQKAIRLSAEDKEEAIRRSDLFLTKMTSSEIFH